MTKTELYDILIDNGWTIRQGTAYKQLSDRQIQLTLGIKKLPNSYSVSMSPSVSTIEFSKIGEYIDEGKKSRRIVHYLITQSLEYELNTMQIEVPTKEFIENRLPKIEIWAKQQKNLEVGIQEYCKLSTESKGNLPLLHLSALAITGQTAKLESYLEHFKRGDRLGFVPYIKQDHIERALEISKNN